MGEFRDFAAKKGGILTNFLMIEPLEIEFWGYQRTIGSFSIPSNTSPCWGRYHRYGFVQRGGYPKRGQFYVFLLQTNPNGVNNSWHHDPNHLIILKYPQCISPFFSAFYPYLWLVKPYQQV